MLAVAGLVYLGLERVSTDSPAVESHPQPKVFVAPPPASVREAPAPPEILPVKPKPPALPAIKLPRR